MINRTNKKVIAGIISFILLAVIFLFIYRYNILRYSAEAVIRNSLPSYVSIDKIKFDFQKNEVLLIGFDILNPPYFINKYSVEIEEIRCGYKLKGKSILNGLEIINPVLRKPVINIERLSNGKINLIEMRSLLEDDASRKAKAKGPEEKQKRSYDVPEKSAFASLIKIPQKFLLKNGKIVFTDRVGFARPHIITFENIDAEMFLQLNDDYSKVLGVASAGSAMLNGYSEETIRWKVSLNPTTPRLTMSNNFEVDNLSIPVFEPYYDKYSPFVFKAGRVSGSLIFDFDNGNIGSTNELHLSGLKFYVKQGFENAQFWETTVPDLIKYFSTSSGEIVFDFKIKGDVSNPRFYLGPISKQALTSMAIDKISSAIEAASKAGKGGVKSSDVEKAKEYIDLFQSIVNKK